MKNDKLVAPFADQIEVNIWGPGYGEAIAVHLGGHRWVLVDSCLNPRTGKPASLEYLKNVGVDVNKEVEMIVATHWHDDHVRGLGSVVDECVSAKIVLSSILKSDQLIELVSLYQRRTLERHSGVDEFRSVFRTLIDRKSKGKSFYSPSWANPDRQLFHEVLTGVKSEVEIRIFSLSPSDVSALRATLMLSEFLPGVGSPKRRVVAPEPNQASVVLLIQIGDERLLLGADLEYSKDQSAGWSAILETSSVISDNVKVFKVPHHGAKSAHDPRVWSEVLAPDPLAILTPFSRGNQLIPTIGDMARLSGLTPNAYITAPPSRRNHKFKNRVVRETVEGVTKQIYNAISGWGHIRLRKNIQSPQMDWQIDTFGDAKSLRA